MKTFNTTEELTAIINYAIYQHCHFVTDIRETLKERQFEFSVVKINNYFKVDYSYIIEPSIVLNGNSSDINPIESKELIERSWFKILETESYQKLDSYLEDIFTLF